MNRILDAEDLDLDFGGAESSANATLCFDSSGEVSEISFGETLPVSGDREIINVGFGESIDIDLPVFEDNCDTVYRAIFPELIPSKIGDLVPSSLSVESYGQFNKDRVVRFPSVFEEDRRERSSASPLRKNKRLKLGCIHIPLVDVGPYLLSPPSSITLEKKHNNLVGRLPRKHIQRAIMVLKEIVQLETFPFSRADLTKNLRNKMRAKEIKDVLGTLVNSGVLEEITVIPKLNVKGGRPKTEQYKVLWEKSQILSAISRDSKGHLDDDLPLE